MLETTLKLINSQQNISHDFTIANDGKRAADNSYDDNKTYQSNRLLIYYVIGNVKKADTSFIAVIQITTKIYVPFQAT